MRQTFKLNGTDYSSLANKYEYSVKYEKREGPNGGMMQDGTQVVDVLAWKAVIFVSTNGMDATQRAALLNELIADYVTVTFTDPRTGSDRTSTFIPDAVDNKIAFWKGSIGWYTSTTITLTES